MRAVARAARQATHARAVCCALGAALLTLALVVGSGHALGDPEGIALAVGIGLLAGASWVASVGVDPDGVARRLDQGLELDGALLAAYENAMRPERPMAELGAERIVDRECWSLAQQVAVPHYAGFLAVPLLGAAALLQTVAAADARGAQAVLELRQVRGVASGVEQALSAHAGELGEDELAALGAALAAAREASSDGELAGEAMDSVADTLGDLAAELPPDSEAARELRELALRAEVLGVGTEEATEAAPAGSDELGPRDSGPETPGEQVSGAGEGGSGDIGPDEAESSRGAPDEGPGGAAAAGGPEEASGGAAPSVGESDTTQEAQAGLPGPDGGTAAADAGPPSSASSARWWSERDDALVRRWLARERSDGR